MRYDKTDNIVFTTTFYSNNKRPWKLHEITSMLFGKEVMDNGILISDNSVESLQAIGTYLINSLQFRRK